MPEVLKPCPFCGGGEINSAGQYMAPRMDGSSNLISWRIQHWCRKVPGSVSAYIEYRGRDEASAIAQWNQRVENA